MWTCSSGNHGNSGPVFSHQPLCLCAVELCDGTSSLHLQKVLHVGLWPGEAVHQHHRRGPPGKTSWPAGRSPTLTLVAATPVRWVESLLHQRWVESRLYQRWVESRLHQRWVESWLHQVTVPASSLRFPVQTSIATVVMCGWPGRPGNGPWLQRSSLISFRSFS